jgi:hypothetical protein
VRLKLAMAIVTLMLFDLDVGDAVDLLALALLDNSARYACTCHNWQTYTGGFATNEENIIDGDCITNFTFKLFDYDRVVCRYPVFL